MATARIGASPEAVWSVLTDFQRWPEFFPGISKVSIETRDDGRLAVRQTSGKLGYQLTYTTLTTLDARRGRVEQALDPSASNDVRGARFTWQLIPIGKRDATLVELRVHFDSGQPVPHFIQRKLTRAGALQSAEALAAEVERRCSETLLAMAD